MTPFEMINVGGGLIGAANSAADPAASTASRVMSGAGGVGSAMTAAGTALGAPALGVGTTGGLGALSMGSVGSLAGAGGTAGAAAGLATGGAVLGAAAGGYATGTAINGLGAHLGGNLYEAERGMGGAMTRSDDRRTLSDRISGVGEATHERVTTSDSVGMAIAGVMPQWLGGDGWW